MLPLSGIKVVEIAQNLAGPFAGSILGSLGAEVVKVERPDGGDDARRWGMRLDGDGTVLFHAVNTNKRSISLDLRNPAELAWLRAYIGGCDVLVQNLRPGTLEEFGLDAASLRAAFPRLIYCSLTAFGSNGPRKMQPGYEPIIQAFAGMFNVNGAPEGPPARVGLQVLDLGTGLWLALGCIAALYRRNQTGTGCVVDASLFETALGWLSISFANYLAKGQPPTRHRSGSPNIVVFQAFDAADGEIVVATGNDRLFEKFARAVGRPEWANDPRFKTNAQRLEHRATLLPAIESLMRGRSRADWIACLEAVGVPCAPINSFAEVAADPQTRAVGIVQAVPDLGIRLVGLPVSFDGTRPPIRRRAPRLGEHNGDFPIEAEPIDRNSTGGSRDKRS